MRARRDLFTESVPQPPRTMTPGSEVTVVIPTFNRSADVQRALANLAAQPGPPLQVIVVDNSSSDGTAEMVAREQAGWGARLQYVRKQPEGPASARNVGLRLAQTPFVLFHDSDIELASGWIARAQAQLDAAAELAAVGGHIVYAFDPLRVNAYGGDLGWFGLAWDVDEGEPLLPREPAERIWINCSAMLVRREAAIAAGGFDDSFFYGYEDSDFGWRLHILGHGVRVQPDLVARHNVEAAPGVANAEIVFHYCKNRLRMLLCNTQARRLPWVLGAYLLYSALDLLARPPRAAKFRALVWNWRQRRSTWTQRRHVQALRRCDDAAIFALGSGRWFPPRPLGGLRRRAVAGAAPAARVMAHGPVDDRV